MLIQVWGADGPQQREVRAEDGATVGQLAAALGLPLPLPIDGRAWAAEQLLAETSLGEGSEVGGADHPPTWPRAAGVDPPAPVALHVVAGLDAGDVVALPVGATTVGRGGGAGVRLASATVSAVHAELRVSERGVAEVRDLGSRNGTRLGGAPVGSWRVLPFGERARFGGVSVRLAGHEVGDRHPAAGTGRPRRLLHHRPPRAPLPVADPTPVELPPPLSEGPSRPALALAAALLPAVAGLVIVAVTGNWLFALLPLLGPVMALGAWYQARRQAARLGRRERARRQADLARLAREVDERRRHELARRRQVGVDLAETVRRVRLPSARLWERRPAHQDFLRLVVGEADVPWAPPLSRPAAAAGDDVVEALAAASLTDVPAVVDLSAGGVLGVVGPPGPARAVARSLVVQAAAHHGPADLRIVALAAGDGDWAWASWLPHCASDGHGRSVAAGADAARAILEALVAGAPPASDHPTGPTTLVVLDDESQLRARRGPLRAVLRGVAGPVAGVVVASDRARLPASCTAVLEVEGEDGAATLRDLRSGQPPLAVLVAGLSAALAGECARALARLEDAEAPNSRGAPDVHLLDVLGAEAAEAGAVVARWAATFDEAGLAVPLGLDEDGPVLVDLVADGPHALVAGTTGAGKSELLRAWVAGLAAQVDPRLLAIVLVDYKGGAAFDACADLPHVAAVVTDLDAALGARALRGLDAELRRRERCLRDASVADVGAHRHLAGVEPLPRLLVVVDEFATLAAELPEFLDALVGVAQRGRSLGVHLVLATQRPAGVVNDAIRANTNLRIALRVQDDHDARDVVGSDLPARLPRGRPGAAVVRFGPDELVRLQVAHASAPAPGGAPPPPVQVRPPDGQRPGAAQEAGATGATQLEAVVAACRAAASQLGLDRPMPPWPDPLPALVRTNDLPRLGRPPVSHGTGTTVPLWLADDPGHQVRRVGGWRPAEGNLLVYGKRGSGTTTTLVSAVAAQAAARSPALLHVYAIDAGRGLEPLLALPHTGAVVALGDGERLERLLARLAAELDARRSSAGEAPAGGAPGDRPDVLLVVDGIGALFGELDQPGALVLVDQLQRWYVEGPGLGLLTLASADRPGAVRHGLGSATAQRLALALADPLDARALGVPAVDGVAGRGVDLASGLEVQVAHIDAGGLAAVAARWPGPWGPGQGGPTPVERLPDVVPLPSLLVGGPRSCSPPAEGPPWPLPVGLGGCDLEPISLLLHHAEHVLVAGPPRSGRTTALLTVAAAARATIPGLTVVTVTPNGTDLRAGGPGAAMADESRLVDHALDADLSGLEALLGATGPALVLVDDAELVPDGHGVLERVVGSRRAGATVVAAGRADALRSSYTPWLRLLRQSRCGVFLQPDVDLDGDLLGVRLPRRQAAPSRPGRGYLVQSGSTRLVQLARM